MTRRCKKCGEVFPATGEYFVILKKGEWRGLATECRPCRNLRFRPYYEANRPSLIARATASTQKRRERPEVRKADRVSSRERKRRMLADPVKRAEHAARGRKWRRDNPEKAKLFKHEQRPMKAERVMRRYARKLNATPAWADQRKIETIYAIAAFLSDRTGVEHEVDHFYPLMGRRSCGLHVPENMRVITALANREKGCREPL